MSLETLTVMVIFMLYMRYTVNKRNQPKYKSFLEERTFDLQEMQARADKRRE